MGDDRMATQPDPNHFSIGHTVGVDWASEERPDYRDVTIARYRHKIRLYTQRPKFGRRFKSNRKRKEAMLAARAAVILTHGLAMADLVWKDVTS